MKSTFIVIGAAMLLCGVAAAAETEWNPAAARECDRACLVDYMNRYMDAMASATAGRPARAADRTP
jgi:hypothetical protein